jgi:hypothetical protein
MFSDIDLFARGQLSFDGLGQNGGRSEATDQLETGFGQSVNAALVHD